MSIINSQLSHLRQQIDQIDNEVLELIAQRMSISREVAQYKKQSGKAVYDGDRERLLFERLVKIGKELGLPAMAVKGIWHEILTQSRRIQQQEISD